MGYSNLAPLHVLPSPIFCEICNYLDVKELSHLGQTDKKLAKMVSECRIWESLFRKDFSKNRTPEEFSKSKKPLWQKLYCNVAKKWHETKTYEDRKKVAEEQQLDIKLAELAKQSADCLTLCASIIKSDAEAVSEKLKEALDPEVFKLTYLFDQFIVYTPLNLAASVSTSSPSDSIFLMVLEKVKNNKELLKINQGGNHTFLILLQQGAISHAKALIEALEGDTDHLLDERSFSGVNVFHELAHLVKKPLEAIEIAESLFKMPKDPKKAEEYKRKLCELMLSKPLYEVLHSGLPLHTTLMYENLPLTKLYIQKLRELDILNECLNTPDSKVKTPLDLLKKLRRTKNWPDLIS